MNILVVDDDGTNRKLLRVKLEAEGCWRGSRWRGSFPTLMMDEPRNPDDELGLKQILSSVERAASLTRQLLMFSRRQEADANENKIDTSLARRGHETILLVEDEAPLRALTRAVLERHGYRVMAAASGVDALAQWEKCAPEFLIAARPDACTNGHT